MGTLLLRAFHDLDKAPTFVLAEWAGFHDAHGISNVRIIGLVVSEKPGGPLDELAVNGMLYLALDGDCNAFLHAVAHDDAYSFLSDPTCYLFHILLD